MNITEESIDFKYYRVKRTTHENFGTQLRHFCQLFRFYSSVILVIVGMIGSMLSIKVFSSTKIRRNSSNEYLITMSFVIALLLFNFFCDEVLRSIVHDFRVDLPLNLVDLSRPLCKCSTYFRHTLRFAAHWIVVAFTLERLIVVYFPLQTSVLCNPRSARRICLFILIISFLLPFYSFLMSDVNVDEKHHLLECDIMNKFKKIYFYLTIIYGNLTLTFPILIVCIVNILTVRQLLRAGRLRKKQQQQQLSQTKKFDSANNEYVNMIVKNQLENDKVTWMLVVISITFGILNFPYFILWLAVCIIRVRGKTPSDIIESAKMVSEVFHILNYSLYFFLYVISRRSFRKVLIEKMRWRCDWFEQWRLNEMRIDAALRSQQIPKQPNTRNVNGTASLMNRTSLTDLHPNSSRRLVPLRTINDNNKSNQSAFFTSSTDLSRQKTSRKRQTKYSKDTVNHRKSSINQRTLSSIQRLTNNLNAIRSSPTKNSNEQSSNLTSVEQKQIQQSYQIPSPTILLPNEFSSSPKSITNSKIQRSTPIDNHQNLKFHLINNTEELRTNSDQISTTSICNLNLSSQQIQISHHEGFSIENSIQNLSTKQSNVFIDKPNLSPPFKLLQFEHPTETSPFEISPSKIKIHHEIKPESESLWKTKLTLKTVLSIANRDEAQALKNRKPIDYHMFLSNKFNKNSILQYNDYIDTKLTTNNKNMIIEQDYKENRKLYKRLLSTMGLRKPINTKTIESMTSIKQIKTKRRNKITIQENTFSSFDETEKPVLITYQAIPISISNK